MKYQIITATEYRAEAEEGGLIGTFLTRAEAESAIKDVDGQPPEPEMTDFEKELYDVLDLIVGEFRADPKAIVHFDSQTVLRATRLVDDHHAARQVE